MQKHEKKLKEELQMIRRKKEEDISSYEQMISQIRS